MNGRPLRNEYLPRPFVVRTISRETFDVLTFGVEPQDPADRFAFLQGQFAEVSVLGVGEAPISISSSPRYAGTLDFTVRAAGRVTKAMHELRVGDRLHLRGPYGNSFPFDRLGGRDLYFVAGGIGLAPLRGLLTMAIEDRARFGAIKLLYGAKSPDELCFKDELREWAGIPGVEVFTTVDKPAAGWSGRVGLVTTLYDEAGVKAHNATAIVCGPPIMIKFAAAGLAARGFADADILMTLERYMKCGVGKCGHCNIGGSFVCVDGPVFDYAQVKAMPEKEGVF